MTQAWEGGLEEVLAATVDLHAADNGPGFDAHLVKPVTAERLQDIRAGLP